MKDEVPLYATLLYDVRKALDISWSEYVYLDMVQKLTINQRWCSKSLENTAIDLGITKMGVLKLRKRMVAKGLIELNEKGHPKVTKKYINVAVNKVDYKPQKSVNKVYESVNKVYSNGKLSLSKNNNRVTKNNYDEETLETIRKMREAIV